MNSIPGKTPPLPRPAAPRVAAGRLVGIALAGQGVAYGLAILMARRLGVAGFEAYVVASAIFILLASFAPRGAEKYTLRYLPALIARNDLAGAHGLLRFGAGRTLATALVTGASVAVWALAGDAGPVRTAILVTCLSLPAGALVHLAVEVLTALGRPRPALLIFRLVVPALALGLALLLFAVRPAAGGPAAVACWGVAWLVAMGLMAWQVRAALPPGLLAAPPRQDLASWRPESRPFLVYRLSLSLLAQAGVLALERLGPGAAQTGAYAAAMSTVAMAAVLATATNRAYARELAVLIEAGDFAGLMAARRARLRWLLPAVAGFLGVTLLFPGPILALFRPEFAAAGATPLRLLALATAITVTFSLSPTYLKFQKRNRVTYTGVAIAAAAQLLLLLILVPLLGATGAALAYLLAMGGMYLAFAAIARREVLALKG